MTRVQACFNWFLLLFKFYLDGLKGVGRIGLIDHDTVEVSNLHRQVLHTQSRVGVSKAVSLAASLAGINPSLQVKSIRYLPQTGNWTVILDRLYLTTLPSLLPPPAPSSASMTLSWTAQTMWQPDIYSATPVFFLTYRWCLAQP